VTIEESLQESLNLKKVLHTCIHILKQELFILGTINFESFSPERVNGEVASPPSGNHPGSLSYNATGEYFFLPFGAQDISTNCQLNKGDKVYIII